MTLNIDKFDGVSYDAPSGNKGIIKKLADGAVRVTWRTQPSGQDKLDIMSFIEEQSGEAVEFTTSDGVAQEAVQLSLWQEQNQLDNQL